MNLQKKLISAMLFVAVLFGFVLAAVATVASASLMIWLAAKGIKAIRAAF